MILIPRWHLPSSQTGRVEFQDVEVPNELLLSGPTKNVLKSDTGVSTGGLQTSALAIGLASAAVGIRSQSAE